MAKIEMDVSEYEAMKKVETLLQESLEREKKQADTIQQLNQEKIAALEQNENKITKISTKRVIQQALIPSTDGGTRLNNVLSSWGIPVYGMDFFGSQNHHVRELANALFEIKESEIIEDPIITLQGMQESRTEIEEVIKGRIDQETKDSLARGQKAAEELEKTKTQLDRALSKLDYSDKSNKQLSKQVDKLLAKRENLEKKIEETEKLLSKFSGLSNLLNLIEEISSTYTAFNKGKSLSAINEEVKKFRDSFDDTL